MLSVEYVFLFKVSPFDLQKNSIFLPTKNHWPQKLYYSIHDEHNGDSEHRMANWPTENEMRPLKMENFEDIEKGYH